jgi:hypothetical protein
MTSSFLRSLPGPLQNVSNLAMLASLGAHVIFFAGSTLLSAQESTEPEKLRVVRLLPNAQSAVQPPQNPNAPLPVPALPPRGASSFAGLPTLRPGEQPQVFRTAPTVGTNPNIQALAKQQQVLRQQLALRRQQEAQQVQQAIEAQQQQAQQQAQQAQQQARRQQVLEQARQQQAQQQARANPLTDNNPQREWEIGSSDVRIPPVAAGQNPDFGQQQDGFPLNNPPADPKRQAFNPGRSPAPAVDPGEATQKLSQTNQKIAEVRGFLAEVVKLSGRIPDRQDKPEETIASPAGADFSKADNKVVEVRTYITKEGEKAATRLVEKADQEVLNQAALAAVAKYKPERSEFDKTLVFRYSFKPGGTAPASPGQASDPAQSEDKEAATGAKNTKDSAQSPAKDQTGKDSAAKQEDKPAAKANSKPAAKQEKKDEQPAAKQDPKPDAKTAKPAARTETKAPAANNSTAPGAKQPPAAANSAPAAKDAADQSDAVGGAELEQAPKPPTSEPTSEPEEAQEDVKEENTGESDPLPSSHEEDLLKKLKLKSLQ